MLEEYKQRFAALKKEKYSVLVRKIRVYILKEMSGDKFSDKLHVELKGMNTSEASEPFTDYAEDPEQISQVKKLINALYHAEKALIDLETRNFRDVAFNALKVKVGLPDRVVNHIYEAAMLVTHLDIDLREIFGEELAVLTSRLTAFQEYAVKYSENARTSLSKMDVRNLPHQMGVAAGTIVNLMGPKSGEVDYKFITKFGADLSEHLNKLTKHIQAFTSDVSHYQPSIDKKKLAALKSDASLLLNELETIQGSSIFMPLKTLHFIHIIRHTITLSMSIFEQIGHLNESSQDYVRDKLKFLRKELLPQLFGLADKIETALLRPGLLSGPLMASVSTLYQALTGYAGKLVEFSKKGQELVTVEDSVFVQARLGYSFKRIADNHRKLFLLGGAERASAKFFSLLEQEMKGCSRLIDLPLDTRNALAELYKIFEPYVLKLDVTLNNAIIGDLTGEKTFLDRHTNLRWAFSYGKQAAISNILLQKKYLDAQFIKIRNTIELNDKLNNDIIHYVSTSTYDLKLFEAHTRDNPFDMSSEEKQIREIEQLSITDALNAFQLYQKKCLELEFANEAFKTFYTIIINVNAPEYTTTFNEGCRKKLRNLYGIFQPYLVSGATCAIKAEVLKKLDKEIIAVLSWNGEYSPGADVGVLEKLKAAIVSVLSMDAPRARTTGDAYSASILTDFKHKIDVHFDMVRSIFAEKCGQFGAKFNELNALKIQAGNLACSQSTSCDKT